MKTDKEWNDLLDLLLAQWEDEVVEFKQGGEGFSTHDIGKYFSALSNEANLRGAPRAWLVFGVDNKTRQVVGSGYDASSEALNRPGGLKQQIAQGTDPGVCLGTVKPLDHPKGLVVFFEIPAAPQGVPIAWKGHYYARAGENLTALGLDKIEAIRRQGAEDDWSAVPVEGATLDDLNPTAVDVARRAFAEKHAQRFPSREVESWDLPAFLDRAHLARGGRITRAALLLVGREESAHLLSPHPAQLVWKLEGEERANEIFRPPFLLATTALYARIRNVQVRILPEGSLLPAEIPKYEAAIVLEALHNCIAHQDYRRNGRVIVTEYVDRLTFFNLGSFYDGTPADYVNGTRTPVRYRNPQLVSAMRELNMIDIMGYGIHRIYEGQAKRYFPLPDYETNADSVGMTLYGKVVDPAYSSLLMRRGDLRLDDICLLDRVQKGLPVPRTSVAHLRREGLVEGRMPRLHVSAKVAAATGQKTDYMRKKELPGVHYQRLLVEFLQKFNGSTRQEINDYLMNEIRGELSARQKTIKIGNLLSQLRQKGIIRNTGSDARPRWVLIDTDPTKSPVNEIMRGNDGA